MSETLITGEDSLVKRVVDVALLVRTAGICGHLTVQQDIKTDNQSVTLRLELGCEPVPGSPTVTVSTRPDDLAPSVSKLVSEALDRLLDARGVA